MMKETGPENKKNRYSANKWKCIGPGGPDCPCCTGKYTKTRPNGRYRRKHYIKGGKPGDLTYRHAYGWEKKKSLRDHRT